MNEPTPPTVYVAHTDENGVLLVERFGEEDELPTLERIAQMADQFPEVIYFTLEPQPNHVTFLAVDDGTSEGTWSVYREEYAANNLDEPLDGKTFVVATVLTESRAAALVRRLWSDNVRF